MTEREELEQNIKSALDVLRGARSEEDLEIELDAENDLNANLEAYSELIRGIGRVGCTDS